MIIHEAGQHTLHVTPHTTEVTILQLNDESISVDIIFDQPDTTATIRALTIGRGDQNATLIVNLHHQAANTTADFNGRAWLREQSQLDFRGLIKIEDTARATESYLTHRTLLQDKAGVQPQPALEISQNEVRASHSATVTRLDANALFFLRARGLDQATAERLLTTAFLSEITDHLPDEWQPTIDHLTR